MPRRFTVTTLLATACLAGAVHSVVAQEAPTPTRPGQGTTSGPGGFRPEQIERPKDVLGLEERVTIDFKGGTVAEYIQAVRNAATPKAVNILVPTEVMEVPLPAIKLQSVTLWAAWSAMEPAIRAQSNGLEIKVEALGGRMGSNVSSEAVQILTNQNFGNPFRGDPMRPTEAVEVISIADLVEPRSANEQPLMKVEDVLAAIEATALVAAEAGNPTPKLKFHPASGVLISRGTNGANALVSEVVATVRKNAAARAEQQDRMKYAKDSYEQRLLEVRSRLETAKNMSESAKRRMSDLEKLVAAGSVSQAEFQAAKDAYLDTMGQVNATTKQVEMLEHAGVEGILATIPSRSMGNQDVYERLAKLEREVETLRGILGINQGQTLPSRSPPGGRNSAK